MAQIPIGGNMKVMGVFLVIAFLATTCYAVDYKITLTDEQDKAISVLCANPQVSLPLTKALGHKPTPQDYLQLMANEVSNNCIASIFNSEFNKKTLAERKVLLPEVKI